VFRRQCHERKSPNVLVVGDSVGDVNMSHGNISPPSYQYNSHAYEGANSMTHFTGLTAGQRLNIGFVNADVDKRTPEFVVTILQIMFKRIVIHYCTVVLWL
jgi:hypothetical protein